MTYGLIKSTYHPTNKKHHESVKGGQVAGFDVMKKPIEFLWKRSLVLPYRRTQTASGIFILYFVAQLNESIILYIFYNKKEK